MTAGLGELLATERYGVLATLSAGRDGWPFASITAFALGDTGDPLLLLSDLAEHTRNVRSDPRASLLVQDSTSLADPQAGPRVTILGVLEAVAGEDLQSARQRYVARHPRGPEYLALGDFQLYALRAREARFIGGFGDIGWINPSALRSALCGTRGLT